MNRVAKKIFKIVGATFLFLLAAAYFVLSTKMVEQKRSEAVCQNLKVQIVDSTAAQLVLEQDIHAFLQKRDMTLAGDKLYQIDLHQLEQLVEAEQGINNCEVFAHLNGVVTLEIAQHSPLLRLETSRGSYYLDIHGALFPTIPQRTAYVPVVSGNIPIEQSEWIAQLHHFGLYIRQNRFWNAQIEQLYIHDPNNIEIVQRAGTHTTVMLGSFERFEYKLQKLYTFYRTIASTQGWDKYSHIDLRFNNQIVARKSP